MAFTARYRAGYSSKGQTGYIYIDDETTDAMEDLTLTARSIKVDYKPKGWEDPIIGLSATFGILNDKADFFELLVLLTATERQYRVRVERVSPSPLTMFSGFLDCDNNEVTYLKNRPIKLVASSYLSKLRFVDPPSVETLQTITFIDYIDDCLRQTGGEFNIRVNCSLYANGDTIASGQTLFSKNGVYSEVFWKNNVDKDNALEVITAILKEFKSYIYWFDGYWYIERYDDIYNATTQSYVEYTTGVSYDPTDSATPYSTSLTPVNFAGLDPVGQSQSIGTNQGKKEIEVKIDQRRLFNFTVNDFGDDNISPISGSVPYPAYRTWQYWNDPSGVFSTASNGRPHKNISNSIFRSGWFGTYDVHRGLYTRFIATIDSETSMSIKFKFATVKGSFGSWSGSWEDYTFEFNWYLRNPTGNYFIFYNSGTDTWTRDSGTEATKYNTTVIPGTEFDDGNVSVEVTITIPIGSVAGLSGDEDFVLCIGTELVKRTGVSTAPAFNCYYGDVEITASGPLTDNHFKGTINAAMLNKLTINVPFSDIESLNLKNGIYRGAALDQRTDTWTDDGVDFYTIATTIIRSAFRLYRINRQRITSKIDKVEFYRPLRNFTDANQPGKQFVLMGYSYSPDTDKMNVILMEYDNTEDIAIV